MCKFHKDVAIQVAARDDGKIDPVSYGIMMCALSRYWIDLYMPEVDYLDGYSNYEMATEQAATALRNSAPLHLLSQNIPTIIDYANEHAPQLRAAVNDIIAEQGLTLKNLGLPRDPVNNYRFVWNITQHLYEGDPTKGLSVVKNVDDPKLEQMRHAVETFFQKPGIEATMNQMMAGSFARLMGEAQANVNPTLLNAYETLPRGLRTAFASCAMHSSGGAVGTHAVCLLLPTAGAANLGMLVAPFASVALDRLLDWRRGNSFSAWRSGSVAAISLALAFGIHAISPHDHLDTAQAKEFASQSGNQQDVILVAYRKDYEALPQNLRQRVDEQSAKKGMTPELYMAVCDGSDTLGRDIAEFKRQQNSLGTARERRFDGLLKTLGL